MSVAIRELRALGLLAQDRTFAFPWSTAHRYERESQSFGRTLTRTARCAAEELARVSHPIGLEIAPWYGDQRENKPTPRRDEFLEAMRATPWRKVAAVARELGLSVKWCQRIWREEKGSK
jgi:hypothetical protein